VATVCVYMYMYVSVYSNRKRLELSIPNCHYSWQDDLGMH